MGGCGLGSGPYIRQEGEEARSAKLFEEEDVLRQRAEDVLLTRTIALAPIPKRFTPFVSVASYLTLNTSSTTAPGEK